MTAQPSTQTKSNNDEEWICKLKRTPEDYMKDRVEHKIKVYTKKARRYRRSYRVIVSVAAIGSLLVPVLVNFQHFDKIVPTIVSLVVAMAVALEGVFHPREHWRNYDLISSLLREEEMRFSTHSDPYLASEKQNEDGDFRTFVDRIEDAIAQERAETVAMRTTAPDAITPRTNAAARAKSQ
jgi:Protein of unknown function (DUF4231)